MKLLSIQFFTAHLVPLLPYRTKMMLNKFLYLTQINFVIFVQKKLVYAQNLPQNFLGKISLPSEKILHFCLKFFVG